MGHLDMPDMGGLLSLVTMKSWLKSVVMAMLVPKIGSLLSKRVYESVSF